MPVQEGTIAVRGLGPLIRDLSKVSKTATKALRARIRLLAEPVKVDIKLNEATEAFGSPSVSGVKVIVRTRGVNVEQTKRRTADVKLRRPNFGPLQMEKAFVPGLEANAGYIAAEAEAFIGAFLHETVTGSLL